MTMVRLRRSVKNEADLGGLDSLFPSAEQSAEAFFQQIQATPIEELSRGQVDLLQACRELVERTENKPVDYLLFLLLIANIVYLVVGLAALDPRAPTVEYVAVLALPFASVLLAALVALITGLHEAPPFFDDIDWDRELSQSAPTFHRKARYLATAAAANLNIDFVPADAEIFAKKLMSLVPPEWGKPLRQSAIRHHRQVKQDKRIESLARDDSSIVQAVKRRLRNHR